LSFLLSLDFIEKEIFFGVGLVNNRVINQLSISNPIDIICFSLLITSLFPMIRLVDIKW
jgi:hypothetical protein